MLTKPVRIRRGSVVASQRRKGHWERRFAITWPALEVDILIAANSAGFGPHGQIPAQGNPQDLFF